MLLLNGEAAERGLAGTLSGRQPSQGLRLGGAGGSGGRHRVRLGRLLHCERVLQLPPCLLLLC